MKKVGCSLALLLALAPLFGQAPPFQLPDAYQMEANISYAQFPETKLDIMAPKAPASVKRPGVIVIHGGGWVGGTKEQVASGYCLPYLEKGFVVANVEYRLAKAAPAPAAVQDVLLAAQWFHKNADKYNVDKNRIIVTGNSAGGHLSLMVGMTPKSARLGPTTKIAAVVNFYGITDVGDQLAGPNMRQYAVTWVPEQQGRFELARRLSPITYVRQDVPPVKTIHGDADKTVPYEHGVNLTKALRDAGADAELLPVPGAGHGFPQAKMNEIYQDIFAFLAKRGILKN
ncbi:MAG: alpha/beta hydrolase [Acidimicrobiia bacterium]|nr:alpha/beta hydrolase [Acidimicrobiia bacterium]